METPSASMSDLLLDAQTRLNQARVADAVARAYARQTRQHLAYAQGYYMSITFMAEQAQAARKARVGN